HRRARHHDQPAGGAHRPGCRARRGTHPGAAQPRCPDPPWNAQLGALTCRCSVKEQGVWASIHGGSPMIRSLRIVCAVGVLAVPFGMATAATAQSCPVLDPTCTLNQVIDNGSGATDDVVGNARPAVDDTGGAAEDAVDTVRGTVDDTVSKVKDTVDRTLGGGGQPPGGGGSGPGGGDGSEGGNGPGTTNGGRHHGAGAGGGGGHVGTTLGSS